ncbi:Thioredoxin-like 3-1, chloroplastic [Triticum urartu]|uniref:Thioredoxin-like 3-1, chloroplastic n=1 Tax=Triticum urartu TaxID=4572 RepID=M7Z7K2_TRIUA|nr:Thioredoxin-like 3-1, chloroplastic [Triticum urartu]
MRISLSGSASAPCLLGCHCRPLAASRSWIDSTRRPRHPLEIHELSRRRARLPPPGGGALWRGGVRVARTGGRGVRAEAAYFWDASVPVEMGEIDSMDKLDAALASSAEQNQPIIIDWFYFVDVNKVPQAVVKRGNISKMPTIQLWKDGEWKEEVIGGHKAWLVMDEVREMIQKYK